MQKAQLQLKSIKLVGIKARTSNKAEFNPETSKIASCFQKFFQQKLANNIPNRVNPGVTFSVFTEYENDYTGEYTCFLGEESGNIENISDSLDSLIIPEQKYIKFTTEAGSMPDIVINSWQKIWQMSPESLGGTRSYRADFEIYDERSLDHKNTIVDIYIGIN